MGKIKGNENIFSILPDTAKNEPWPRRHSILFPNMSYRRILLFELETMKNSELAMRMRDTYTDPYLFFISLKDG